MANRHRWRRRPIRSLRARQVTFQQIAGRRDPQRKWGWEENTMSHNNTSRNAEELSARIKAGEEITFDELERANLTQEERAELLRESLLADIARNGEKSRFIDLGDGRFALRSL